MITDSIYSHNWFILVIRLMMALIAGSVIGWNRQRQHKPGGLRTHMLVSLGAALFVLIPLQVNPTPGEGVSRSIQGIAAGIGFLGAGEILRPNGTHENDREIRGLTSAASIWVTAALGAVSGCGLWELAIVGTGLTWVTLEIVKKMERHSIIRHREERED